MTLSTLWGKFSWQNISARVRALFGWQQAAMEQLVRGAAPLLPYAGPIVNEIELRIKQALKDAADDSETKFRILYGYFSVSGPVATDLTQKLRLMSELPTRFLLQELAVLLLRRFVPFPLPMDAIVEWAITTAYNLYLNGVRDTTPIQSLKQE